MEEELLNSPSILIPESPERPDVHSPENPRLRPENQLSETYTPAEDEENAQALDVNGIHQNNYMDDATQASQSHQVEPAHRPREFEPWLPTAHLYNDTEQDRSDLHQSESSNQSETTNRPPSGPWRPVIGLLDDTSRQSSMSEDNRHPYVNNEDDRVSTSEHSNRINENSADSVFVNEGSRNSDYPASRNFNFNYFGNEGSRNDGINNENSNSVIVSDESRNFSTSNENTRDSEVNDRNPDAVDGVSREEPSSSQKSNKNNEGDNVEPPTKVRKLDTSVQDDGETCPICLECWGNSGAHRLVSLACGHLFGAACVRRWLRARPPRERACPTCKSRARLEDVRCLYARRLTAADTAQIDALQRELDALRAEKNRSELELQKTRIAHRACVMQLEDLRKTLLKTQVKEQPMRKSWRFALEKNLEVNKEGGCRVMTYNCRTYELCVSQKSNNCLFPGYGIRRVSCVDYKLGQFLHLHPKPIRDITYSQPRDLLLSVGLDNTARIVERGILSKITPCGFPLWSCSWDYLRSHEFYVGGNGGVVRQYDVRNASAHVAELGGADLSPVVSLVSTEHGLLGCQLNSCWLCDPSRQWEKKSLPVEGPFMSLCYDAASHRVLVSTRASGTERSRLTVCRLRDSSGRDVAVDTEQTFPGSSRTSVMCRGGFVSAAGGSGSWVAAHSESDGALQLHGLDGARSTSLPASEPALDVCAAQVSADTVLAALSGSRLRLYRAVATS